ncbi:MAG: TonB-dependent hemoglobin/transferrin/lactoferrin family receptor [Ferrimonas sp.]
MINRPNAITLALFAFVNPAVMAAEETVPTASPSYQIHLPEMVVSASRNQQLDGSTVAADVVSLTEDLLAEQLSNDLAQALRYVPGVQTTGSGRFGLQDVNIRGIEGNRVLIMVDGVQQANGYDSGTQFMRSSRNYIDVDSLKQIEIIKTPSSVLFGSGSLAGTVAYTTKDPIDYLAAGKEFGGAVKVDYMGSDQSTGITAALASRYNAWHLLLLATQRQGHELQTKGIVQGEGALRTVADPANFDQINALSKLQYHGDQHVLGFTGEYFQRVFDSELLSLNDGEANAEGVNYADQQADDEERRYRFSLQHQWQLSHALLDELVWSLDYQVTESEQTTQNWYVYTGERQMDRNYGEQHGQFTLDLRKSFTLAQANHVLEWGGDVSQTELENLNTTRYVSGAPTVISRYAPKAQERVYGFYLQDQIQWHQWRITPALRYDNTQVTPEIDAYYQNGTDVFDDHQSDAWTWRLGVVYPLSEQWSLFGQFSQGFRSPDLKELYFAEDSGRGYARLANPNLAAENSDAYEAGLRYSGHLGQFELVAFRTHYNNFIETTVSFSNSDYPYGEYQHENIGQAMIEGIEVSLQWWLDAWWDGLSLDLSAAYAKGENQTDELPINSVSPLNGTAALSYHSADSRWGAKLALVAAQGKEQADIVPLFDAFSGVPQMAYASRGYGVVDLTGYYQLEDNLQLRAGVFNVLDKRYLLWNDVAGLAEEQLGIDRYSQPGRYIGASLSYQF